MIVVNENGDGPGGKIEEGETKMAAVTRDQFEIQGKQVTHVPTGARFTVGGDATEWGRAGELLPNGEDFERKAVLHVAIQIMREIATRDARAPEPPPSKKSATGEA